MIVLLNNDSTKERISYLYAGASDCLSSPFDIQELLIRLRIHLRQCSWQEQPHILTFDDVILDPGARQVFRGDRTIELTAKEFDLLAYFMQHPLQVLTRDQIIETIWGYDFAGTSNVVEVYVRCLRNKLEAHQGKRLIQTVRYVGYVLRI
jgi:two-component system OmpR family response regulator